MKFVRSDKREIAISCRQFELIRRCREGGFDKVIMTCQSPRISMSTKIYRQKRDFCRTDEPSGKEGKGSRNSADEPLFVVQKHDASTQHYDFRLEVDGVLKSWAIPKGPSVDPKEKRLAIPTEDHPLDYADFEGVIPPDEYGGGTVLIWDRGTYENITDKNDGKRSMTDAIEEGHVLLHLHGEKICGAYALHRTDSGKDERWLLVKIDDDHADARRNPVSTETESVASHRTIDEIAEEESSDEDGDDG
jgi:DNA ligase D-like protein (predicted 3'-phosphoesterase)